MKRSIRNILERVGGTGARSAFTLIELLIAVGALVLIAAGVAAIFEATGRTVQAGRRVSAMASYASLIERRMRDDFAAITREGFLIIKNMYATRSGNVYPTGAPPYPDDVVPVTDADEHARVRRTDEIMFFVKGQLVSARELLDARFVAKSDAGAVYYGHGEKARPPAPGAAFDPTDSFYAPSADGFNSRTNSDHDQDARLGYLPISGATNPNRFASDWTLVRHVTLLRPPMNQHPLGLGRPPVLSMPSDDPRVYDGDIQIGLQPAASNLFRSLAHIFPTAVTASQSVRDSFERTLPYWPQRDSGLVDGATTDLSEIKAIITTADTGPGTTGGWAGAGPFFFDPASNAGADGSNKGVDGKSRPFLADPNIIKRQQAWMDDALPAWSDPGAAQVASRHRIRSESAPNNYVGVLSSTYGTLEEQPSRRADQLMLSSSNFLPHCTEFIVEWSFGTQYTSDSTDANYIPEKAGQMVWYGMPRVVNGDLVADTYGVPVVPQGSPAPRAFPYPWNIAEPQYYTRVDGAQPSHDLDWSLVHSPYLNPTQDASQPVTSYFGYTDPTFNPDMDAPVGTSIPDGKLESPGDSRSPTVPWAWPRFIRVTMSLSDPNNPSVEQSFQFVFDVPGAAAQ